MGLGKTLECIGLVIVHPHSPQPFPLYNEATGRAYAGGTAALEAALAATSTRDLRSGLFAVAAIPSDAKDAYELPMFGREANRGGVHAVVDRRGNPDVDKMVYPPPPPGSEAWVRVQMEARLAGGFGLLESRATVVLVPPSLAHQWQAECAKWAPQLAVVIYESPGPVTTEAAVRGMLLAEGSADPRWARQERALLELRARLVAADVVIVSFSTLEQEAKTARAAHGPGARTSFAVSPLLSCQFTRIVVDESQMIGKAAGAGAGGGSWGAAGAVGRRMEMACAIAAVSRWCVSGTPLSSPEDVGSVLTFLQHQPFSAPTWWRKLLLPALQTALVRQQERGRVAAAVKQARDAAATVAGGGAGAGAGT
jgi:hypothetical protein